MKILVGLGNPGAKYKNNRHNVGYMFVDYIVPLLHCSIVKEEKLFITMKQSNHKTITLAKPLTFMNNSGIAVYKIIKNFKFQISNLIVAHDDLDIPFGKFHIQFAVGPSLHNGLESIENHLKTKDFWRIRIGIDNRQNGAAGRRIVPGEAYVLNNFTKEELMCLKETIFPKIFSQLKLNSDLNIFQENT